jgi:hypothetical protein
METGMHILAATLASAAFIYLLFAIARPERF